MGKICEVRRLEGSDAWRDWEAEEEVGTGKALLLPEVVVGGEWGMEFRSGGIVGMAVYIAARFWGGVWLENCYSFILGRRLVTWASFVWAVEMLTAPARLNGRWWTRGLDVE